MKARGGIAFFVCAVAVLALPAAAAAKPGYYVSKPFLTSWVSLHGSNGYEIDVFGIGRNQIWIVASKDGASASYLGRGKVSDGSIAGRFGNLGRVSVRLSPSARLERLPNPDGCKGRVQTRRNGRFAGVIRFRGERGFTSVRAAGGRGSVYRGYRMVCKSPRRVDSPPRQEPPTTSLSAVSSRYPRAPWFSVFKQEPARKPAFATWEGAQYTARTIERQPGLDVFRQASAAATPATFAVSPLGASPVTATVAPPEPFTGTASYEKQLGGAVTWSGDLAIELPGRGVVPLADSTYHAELCHSFACACPIGECFFVSVGVVQGRAERLRRLAARVRP